MRPLKAYINLSALTFNLQLVKKIAKNSKVMAVLKANAYGHGLVQSVKAIKSADGIAILTIEEAIKIRGAGFKNTILLLEGLFTAEDIYEAEKLELNLVVHNEQQIEYLNDATLKNPINVHLKINTGMNRLGFPPDQIDYLIENLNVNPNVSGITLMTHFATADEKEGIAKQLACFNRITNNYNFSSSVANSAALYKFPEARLDWVRPGIMLYGASPFEDISAKKMDVKPVMSLISKIIAIQNIKKGQAVGYGNNYIAKKDMRIGIVACGYGDGYPRHAKTGTPVFVHHKNTTTVGRVSMDMLYVDISNIADAKIGSKVEMWGNHISVDEVAKNSGTVGYELLCNISASSRVPMEYLDG
ncbi:MAG: alanine racemase [Nitrosomonadales bacterium]|jgi:alanine racemase|nr:alanine racemase [Nitrosomonadales bacterium]MBT3918424.1 alanine racemase [Nitrosomonadales bacterium]MBT4182712.1 alanine racemase [Nitrosomonadales bacterium]MBT4570647.1 alanine racemase [Nitrosomonadales bacterium]MBT4759182.1 alanine racemase [Nitrosomonadales bacterium]